jgi:hypothetical protein
LVFKKNANFFAENFDLNIDPGFRGSVGFDGLAEVLKVGVRHRVVGR